MSSNSTAPEGPEFAQAAWRLSGRVVAGVGQLLLWALHGLGRLLRPIGERLYGKRAAAVPVAGPGGTRLLGPTAPLPRWINIWQEFSGTWWFAPLTGFALAAAALAELGPHKISPLTVTGGFAVATTLPLVWRREYLRPVAALVLGAFAAALLSGQQLMVTSVLAALYTLYALGRHLSRPDAGLLAVSAIGVVLVVHLVSNSLAGIPVIASVIAVVAAIGLGDARRVVESAERTETATLSRLDAAETRLDAAEREQAVLRERARIARELHDVVAHSVSMIAVQAETAPYTMRDLSPEAAEGYREIAGTAREALVEMRRLLGMLRADAEAGAAGGRGYVPDTAPQPRLDRLPDLIERHRGAGGHAEMAVMGDPRGLSATIELSAYRIVQEALTNARRHAPGANVRVELDFRADRLAVRVRDDGPGTPAQPGPGGHGLLGMRERAVMLGGHFAAGPATGGGFMVEAELPTKTE